MKSQTSQINDSDEDKVLKIVDRVLTQVFGRDAACLIYRYLESKYSLKRNDIAERIDLFAKGLEEFLSSGACIIERKILEDIYSSYGLLRRLELERIQEQHDFVGQVRLLAQKA